MLQQTSRPTVPRSPWLTLFLSILPTGLLMSVDKQAMAVLAPMIQDEFDFDVVTMTKILAAASWSYAIFQIPAGWLAEKVGPYRTLAFSCIAWSLSVMLTPFATVAWMFFACRFLMGAGQAPDWTATMMIIRRSFPVTQRSRASSYGLGALYLGTLISAPASIFIAQRSDWQTCFFIFGSLGLVFGVLMLTVLKQPTELPPDAIESSNRGKEIGSKDVMSSRQVHALALAYFCLVGIQSFFFALLPLYLVAKRGMSLSSMGWYASAPFLTLYVAVLVGGALSDFIVRNSKSVIYARLPMGLCSMIGSVTFFSIGLHMPEPMMMVLFLCLGSAMVGLGQVVIWSSVQDLSSGRSGLIAAWTGFLGHVSLGLIPILAAYLVRWTGEWNDIGFIALALGAAGSLTLFFVRSDRPIVR